jgi:hypothetical protein
MKRKPFTLKSGNTVPFKQMGSSPVKQGQADASLVAAARATAMANVPKDLSAQYNEAAKGAIAAHKGKTEMLTTLAKEAPGILTAAGRGIQKGVGKIRARIASKKAFKEVPGLENISKKERRKTSDKVFEKAYQEKHKDRRSIADIREITGADGSVADKDRDFKKEWEQEKYKKKLQKNKNKNKKEKGNEKNLLVNDTIKLKRTDLSKGLADSNRKSEGFGTDIGQY